MGNRPEWGNNSGEPLLAQVPGGTDRIHMTGTSAQENRQLKKALKKGSGAGLRDVGLKWRYQHLCSKGGDIARSSVT